MKDEKLLRSLRSKDPRALEAAMERYGPYVAAVVWNILRGSMTAADGEEVAADVFYALWEKAGRVEPGKLKAWLGAVARNQACRKLREQGRELPLEEDLLELSDGATPFTQLSEKEERLAVRRAVEDLGEPDREIFLRHYYYIQSVSDISREMEINESTVKSRLRRGRQKLKDSLEKGGSL